jgi:hypothetical protein
MSLESPTAKSNSNNHTTNSARQNIKNALLNNFAQLTKINNINGSPSKATSQITHKSPIHNSPAPSPLAPNSKYLNNINSKSPSHVSTNGMYNEIKVVCIISLN